MSVGLQFDLTRVNERLEELRRRGLDPQPLLVSIKRILLANVKTRFRRERGPDGTPWKKSKRALKDGGQTLSDTRRLRNSITGRAGGGEVVIGTNVVYAASMQLGDKRTVQVSEHQRQVSTVFGRRLRYAVVATVKEHDAKRNLRGWPFLGFGPEDERDILDEATDYLNR